MEQFNQYFLDTVKSRYAKFDGRATRSEYWYFALFTFLITFMLALVDAFVINPMLGMTPEQAAEGGILQMVISLALLIPSIAVAIRRLHDIGKSGWWLLLSLIPILGWLVLLYFYVTDSQSGDNEYGANLKGA